MQYYCIFYHSKLWVKNAHIYDMSFLYLEVTVSYDNKITFNNTVNDV